MDLPLLKGYKKVDSERGIKISSLEEHGSVEAPKLD
jgi:hypothetical protein